MWLGKHRRSAQQLSRPDHLTEARERAARDLSEARQLAQRIEQEKTEQQRYRAQSAQLDRDNREARRLADKQASEQQRRLATARRQEARAALTPLREKLRELERLYRRTGNVPGSGPLQEFARLGLIRYVAAAELPATDEPRGFFAWLRAPTPEPPGRWVTNDGQAYLGSPGYCAALTTWGTVACRAVLAPALRAGYAREDALRAAAAAPHARRASISAQRRVVGPPAQALS